jgi:hypothetical protein
MMHERAMGFSYDPKDFCALIRKCGERGFVLLPGSQIFKV